MVQLRMAKLTLAPGSLICIVPKWRGLTLHLPGVLEMTIQINLFRYELRESLNRTVPTIVIAHMLFASRDT